MASITTRNSRRSKSITSPLEGMDVEGLSHSAVKLHARKMKPTSRVIPAREQYNDSMKDDHPQTKLHDTPQPKRFGTSQAQEYGAIKLSAEIGSVHEAINKMNDVVAKRRSEIAQERDKSTDEALKAKDFSFQKKDDELSPKALRAIRLVVRDELENAAKNNGSGFGLTDALLSIGGGILANKIPGLPKGPGKGPTGPTVPQTGPGVPTPQAPASKAPMPVPVPTGGAKPVPTSAGRGRVAYDKAGRMGSIFRRTVEKKGLAGGISRMKSIMSPGSGSGGFATKAAGLMSKGVPFLGLALYGLDAVQQKEGLDELLENGAITKDDYDKAVKELTAKKVGGALGIGASMLAGAAAGSLLGPVGTAVGAVGGLAVGIGATIAGEKLGSMAVDEKRQKARQEENWNKFNETNKLKGLPTVDPKTVPKPVKKPKEEKIPMPTRDKTQPVPEGVVESIKNVSKEFGVPYEEMIATAEQESGMNPKAKNPESSATGLFQHTTDTWNNLVKKFPEVAQDYDIKKVSLMRDDRMDPYKSSVMYAVLRKDDQGMLKGSTTGYSVVDTYLTHLLGAPTAKDFLRAYQEDPNQLITSVRGMTSKVLNQNISIFKGQGRWFTLEEVVQRIKTIKAIKLEQGLKRIAKSEKLRQSGSSSSGATTNPVSSTAAPKESSANTPVMPTSKISTTPERITQTQEATKAETQAKQQPAAPVIINAPATQPAMVPMIPQQQVGANLTTRNDNPYVQGLKYQEAMRQK